MENCPLACSTWLGQPAFFFLFCSSLFFSSLFFSFFLFSFFLSCLILAWTLIYRPVSVQPKSQRDPPVLPPQGWIKATASDLSLLSYTTKTTCPGWYYPPGTELGPPTSISNNNDAHSCLKKEILQLRFLLSHSDS